MKEEIVVASSDKRLSSPGPVFVTEVGFGGGEYEINRQLVTRSSTNHDLR